MTHSLEALAPSLPKAACLSGWCFRRLIDFGFRIFPSDKTWPCNSDKNKKLLELWSLTNQAWDPGSGFRGAGCVAHGAGRAGGDIKTRRHSEGRGSGGCSVGACLRF